MRLIVAVMFILWPGAVLSAPITSDEVRVIDGDTIRLHHQKPDIRLVDFNRNSLCNLRSGTRVR
jgi:endonuclease YncB( thermonuclease family)